MVSLLAQTGSFLERTGLNDVVAAASGFLQERGAELFWRLLGAGAIFFLGIWVAKFASMLLSRTLSRLRLDQTLALFLTRVSYALMVTFVALSALKSIGIDTTAVAAVLGAAGLAIGLAFQGSLSNFSAGVMIIVFRPFGVGDFIEAAGTKGVVEEIHIFHTLMRTPDNVQLIVPNGSITGGNISNYSKKPTRRIDLVVGCGYRDDLKAVKQFLTELVESDPRVLVDPAPVVAVSELGDNCVSFVVRPWVKNADYWSTRFDLTEAVKIGFDRLGFQIPFPQRDLHLYREKDVAAGPRKHVVEERDEVEVGGGANVGAAVDAGGPLQPSLGPEVEVAKSGGRVQVTEMPEAVDEHEREGSPRERGVAAADWFRPRRVG